MGNNLKKKSKTDNTSKGQESVFKEAWENMNNDFAKVMPDFISRRLQKKEGRIWVMIVVTLVELVILIVVGKLLYDWFSG